MYNNSPNYLYLDNGFFRWITSVEQSRSFDVWFEWLNSNFEHSVNFISSPFILLEYIGLRVPKPAQLKFDPMKNEQTAEELTQAAFDYAFAQFSNFPSLSSAEILKKAEAQKCYMSTRGIDLYNEILVSRIKDASFGQSLCTSLSLDFSYKHPYPKEVLKEVFTSFSKPNPMAR